MTDDSLSVCPHCHTELDDADRHATRVRDDVKEIVETHREYRYDPDQEVAEVSINPGWESYPTIAVRFTDDTRGLFAQHLKALRDAGYRLQTVNFETTSVYVTEQEAFDQ